MLVCVYHFVKKEIVRGVQCHIYSNFEGCAMPYMCIYIHTYICPWLFILDVTPPAKKKVGRVGWDVVGRRPIPHVPPLQSRMTMHCHAGCKKECGEIKSEPIAIEACLSVGFPQNKKLVWGMPYVLSRVMQEWRETKPSPTETCFFLFYDWVSEKKKVGHVGYRAAFFEQLVAAGSVRECWRGVGV